MQTPTMGREKLFNMRMSEEEWARAGALAAHYGVNIASMLRMLMKREADALDAAKPKLSTRERVFHALVAQVAVRRNKRATSEALEKALPDVDVDVIQDELKALMKARRIKRVTEGDYVGYVVVTATD